MEDGFMNYKSIRIHQLKEKECLDKRTIWLDESIDGDTEYMVLKMFDRIVGMDIKAKISPENSEPILLKISSYGGAVNASLSIISKIESLKKLKYRIYGYAYGKCMSGAFKIFISTSRRFAQPTTDLLCHMPNHGEYGGFYTMEDDKRRYTSSKRSWDRCKKVILKYTNLTDEMLEEAVGKNEDMSFWADESIEQNMGIVDELF
jgi:ATP-dependent protease ClpP protease subunit